MKEIEIKILEINKIELTKKILALGAKKLGTNFVVEKAFDFPNRRISKQKNLMRLRTVGSKVEIAYKEHEEKSISGFKVNNEVETDVKDFETMEKILKLLGLECIKRREKKRTSFVLGDTHFEIDEYPRIPAYLEIEGSPKNIKKYLALLGFTMKQTNSLTATHVLKKYHVNPNFLRF